MGELITVYRISCYLPPESLSAVKAAISRAGGATLGDYEEVFWVSAVGTEQFRPTGGASPTSGEAGKLSELPSVQMVFSLPRSESLLDRVLHAIRESHPWEEPVIYIDETQICRPIERRAKN